MSSLYVYTTEGTCIYPNNGSDDASINRYFESVNFVADVQNPETPSIEAYFRAILPSGRPEQLFLRFQGDDPDSLFDDCRDAVLANLVRANGWEIQRTDSRSDPSMLFQRAVMEPPADPSAVFAETPLANRLDSVQAAVRSSRRSFEVTGRNYETIADAIRALSDTSMVMAVADEDISLSGVGLVFRQSTQQYDLALPRESKQLLREAPAQPSPEGSVTQDQTATDTSTATAERQQIDSELSEIESQLRAIREKNVSQATVREQLDSVVSEVYPPLSVSAGSARSGLSPDDAGDESTDPVQTPPSQGRFSGIIPDVPGGLALGAIVGVGVLVLLAVIVGGLPGGGGSGTPSGEAQFEVTNLDVPGEVTAGEEFNVTVSVQNTGETAGNGTLELDAGELGTESEPVEELESGGGAVSSEFSFQTNESDAGMEYEITGTIGNASNNATVSVEPEPAQPALDGLDIDGNGTDANLSVSKNGSVSVNVTNVGGQAGSFDVALELGNKSPEKTTGELGPDGTETVTFGGVLDDLSYGEYDDVTVSAGNESVSGNLDVLADFSVTIENNNPTVGETLSIGVTLDDAGSSNTPISVELSVIDPNSNEELYDRTVELPSEEERVTEEILTDTDEAGEYVIRATPVGLDQVIAETELTIGD